MQVAVRPVEQLTQLHGEERSGRRGTRQPVEPASVPAHVQDGAGARVRQHGRLQAERDDVSYRLDALSPHQPGRCVVVMVCTTICETHFLFQRLQVRTYGAAYILRLTVPDFKLP